ncbi:hypothetical protein K449DRAFT_186459 [Hypoxylon sp. EC38]|nr:hypothetical protein K449DRAFT_186459 [Hypoxylon sp. EC38]
MSMTKKVIGMSLGCHYWYTIGSAIPQASTIPCNVPCTLSSRSPGHLVMNENFQGGGHPRPWTWRDPSGKGRLNHSGIIPSRARSNSSTKNQRQKLDIIINQSRTSNSS